MSNYSPPQYNNATSSSAFHCPHCNTHAHQHWGQPLIHDSKGNPTGLAVTIGRKTEKFLLAPIASHHLFGWLVRLYIRQLTRPTAK